MTFLIVLSHETQYIAGEYWFEVLNTPISTNYLFVTVSGIWGQVAVAGFVVITAYFTCDKDYVHYVKIEKLWLQAFSTFIILEVFAYFFRPSQYDGVMKGILKGLVSPVNSTWWYLTGYIFLFLFIPVLQRFIKSAEQNLFRKVLLCLLAVTLVGDFVNLRAGGSVVDFVLLYLLTAYIKKYFNEKFTIRARRVNICCSLILIAAILVVRAMGYVNPGFLKLLDRVFVNWNIFIMLAAVSIFYCFRDMKISYGTNVIRYLSSLTFGIYLLHENRFTGPWLWNETFHLDKAYESVFFPVKYLLAATLVFIVSALIEAIRKVLITDSLTTRWSSWINGRAINFVNSMRNYWTQQP